MLARAGSWSWGVLATVMTSIVADRLCGSIPMMTWLICFLLPSADVLDRRGGHRYFELSKPLLSISLPTAPGPRRPNESHATSAGSRIENDEPGTWTEPGRAPVLGQVNK
jgi:hypothetical protein